MLETWEKTTKANGKTRDRVGRNSMAVQHERVSRKAFESHGPVETNVFGFVNHAHSAATELFQDSVVRTS